MDPLTLSLNVVRPAAVRAVARLARVEAGEGETPDHTQLLREALTVLDERLGADRDPSLASAAVFGEMLGHLAWIDKSWLDERMPRLISDASPAYADVVMTTTLATYRPNRFVYDVLRPWLPDWLRRATTFGHDTVAGWRSHREPLESLGDHLLMLYGRAEIELDEELLTEYFKLTPAPTLAKVLGHLGWLLGQNEDVPVEFVERLASLWDWRAESVREAAADIVELSEFSSWVKSEKFEPSWWLPRLGFAATSSEFRPNFIGDSLELASASHPREALLVLATLIGERDEPYRRFDLIRSAPTIIAAALDSGDEVGINAANDLLDRLGRQGHVDMAALVRKERWPTSR
jgi:hypothetical protein